MFRKLLIAATVATLGASASVSLAVNETQVQGTQPTCEEDLDGSGVIDFGDLLILVSNWGAAAESGAAPALQGDIDQSGYVDTGDLLRLMAMYHQKCE